MPWVENHTNGYRVRYRQPNGRVATDSTHSTKEEAKNRASEMKKSAEPALTPEPGAGTITLNEWVRDWSEAHDVGRATAERYRSHLDLHILPRFGDITIDSLSRMQIKSWIKDLNKRRAPATVDSILNLLSMILNDAYEDRRITYNPCRRLRNTALPRPERPWATAEQVHAIADRAAGTARILILTAAYTGMRWGELAGLHRDNCLVDGNRILIDPDHGALHEVGGILELGPPKTPAAARSILLPRFLIDLLRTHLTNTSHDQVFTGPDGGLLRRSNFHRRTWRPATHGHPTQTDPGLFPGLHFHDLRHSHKTWMIEDGIPEAAQAKRLGHKLPGVRGTYSHVTPAVEQHLVAQLQHRWETTTRTT